jgi:hypothetical protein
MPKVTLKRLQASFIPVTENDAVLLSGYAEGEIVTATIPKPLKLPEGVKELHRSTAQNSLHWGWLQDFKRTTINELAGQASQEWHDTFRIDYLLPIYARDGEKWAQTMAYLGIIQQHGTNEMYMSAIDRVLHTRDLTQRLSTTEATVEQFTEYLQCIEHYAHDNCIMLRTDSKMYNLAMGN